MTTPGYIPLLVANQRTGVDVGMDPWLTPPDAFQEILDGYTFRGVTSKRGGYTWFDSIPHILPNSALYVNISAITLGPNSSITVTGNHGFTLPFTVRFNGATGLTSPPGLPSINGTKWKATVTGAKTFTINNDQAFTGAYTGNGTASYFSGNPVMLIATWTDENNARSIMALDNRRASIYDSNANCLVPIGLVDQFSGNDFNYFWSENYRGKIYFTNNLDTMFYWGTGIANGAGLTAFSPQYDGTNAVNRCLMIKAIGSKLVLFNTVENSIAYPTRVRWCQDGVEPTPGTGVGNPWDELTPGRGYFADLLDSNYIISLAKSQTNIFLMSQGDPFGAVYEIRPISDPKYSFSFVNIGTSRNVNSTFGTVILDKVVQMVGNSGLVLTDGNNLSRYDDKIPDFVLNDIDQENIGLCYGQRDDLKWQSWLLYPSGLPDGNGNILTDKNDRVLIYNYQDNSFAFYRLSMCCLGTIEYPRLDPSLESYGTSLPDWSLEDFGDQVIASNVQRSSPLLVGGDYSGNIWYMDSGGGDAADNVYYLQAEDNGQPIEFNLTTRQWFPFAKDGQASQFGFIDFLIDGDPDTDVTVNFQVDNQGNDYYSTQFNCFPYENVLLAQITDIQLTNPCVVVADNHQLSTGDTVFPYGIQGTIELNDNSYTVTVIDSDTVSLNVNATSFTAYVEGGYFSNKPLNASPFWLRVYCGQTGVFHQLQLVSKGVDESFSMHALMGWWKKTGRIYR